MKILLDTHILLWVLTDDPHLSDAARDLIGNPNNKIYYSVVSAWEVEIKHEMHPDLMKMDGVTLARLAKNSGFCQTGITIKAIKHMSSLKRKPNAPPHKDPFDRMLICQASVNDMKLITDDDKIAEYMDEPIIEA